MTNIELLKAKTMEFVQILFPSYEICKSYYFDENLESPDIVTKIMAMRFNKSEQNIASFDFQKYINNEYHTNLYNYINTFLPSKYKTTGLLIYNTLAQNIIQKTCKNENKIKTDKTLFTKLLDEEINKFIELVKSFSDKNDYLFYTHNIKIDEALNKSYLLPNVYILSTDKSPFLRLENIDFNVNIYKDFEKLFIKALALTFGEKVSFIQFADSHSIKLENYGCKNISSLYPINTWESFLKPYHEPLIPFGAKITLTEQNIEYTKKVLPLYLNYAEELCKTSDKNNYKEVSLEFYLDSLDKCGTAKLTYSVIAIEALLNYSRSDIKVNFVQRGLKILQHFYDMKYWHSIEEDLQTAYKIRCDYAHGSHKEHPDIFYNQILRISEYTRIILLCFIQLSNLIHARLKKQNEKKYINEKIIDKSLLYPDVNKHFEELLADIEIQPKDLDNIEQYSQDIFSKRKIIN